MEPTRAAGFINEGNEAQSTITASFFEGRGSDTLSSQQVFNEQSFLSAHTRTLHCKHRLRIISMDGCQE